MIPEFSAKDYKIVSNLFQNIIEFVIAVIALREDSAPLSDEREAIEDRFTCVNEDEIDMETYGSGRLVF
jgi:hypothetical protein